MSTESASQTPHVEIARAARTLADSLLLPARRVRRGINTEASADVRARLRDESLAWRSSLSEDENDALSWYSISGFECVNSLLRDCALEEHKSPHMQEIAERKTALLDSALSKVARPVEPRVLYRIMSYPAGNVLHNLHAFLNTVKVGEIVKNAGFESTSADSDYLVQASGRPDRTYIAVEIVSSRGGVVNVPSDGESCSWSIQDDEREVLLPRGSSFLVTGVLRRVRYESTRDTSAVSAWSGSRYQRRNAYLDVIQMVDITDE